MLLVKAQADSVLQWNDEIESWAIQKLSASRFCSQA
jgi:hypothetical protein